MLTGVLRPDRESRFRPAQVTNSATNTDALSAPMLKPPKTTWPLDNDPGAKRALKYLGNQRAARSGSAVRPTGRRAATDRTRSPSG